MTAAPPPPDAPPPDAGQPVTPELVFREYAPRIYHIARRMLGNDADADRHGVVTPDAGLMNPNHFLAVAIQYLFGGARPGWPASAQIGKTLVSSSMIDRVAADPDALVRMIEREGPRSVLEELADADRLRDAYTELVRSRPRGRRVAPREPLVSVVVPYFRLEDVPGCAPTGVAQGTDPELVR